MRIPHVEIYRARDGYRWRLRAGNGQIVASGESHTQRSDARRAWRTVEQLVITGVGDDDIEPIPVRNVPDGRRGK